MKLKVFSVYDRALAAYGSTYQAATVEAGIRMFKDVVLFGQEDNRFRRSPEDYMLVCVGEFDDESGEQIDGENFNVCSALSLLVNKGEEGNGKA